MLRSRARGRARDERRVVHGHDVDRHRRRCARQVAVAGLIAERRRAVEIRCGRVGERAVGVQAHATARRVADEHRRERVAVRIAVVREHAARGHGEHRVLVRRIGVGGRRRRLVRGRNRDRDGGFAALRLAVARSVLERVRAAEARVGRVAERTVRRERDGAVLSVLRAHSRDRVAVRIGVVPEHPARRHRELHSLDRRVAVVRRGRCAVRDGDRELLLDLVLVVVRLEHDHVSARVRRRGYPGQRRGAVAVIYELEPTGKRRRRDLDLVVRTEGGDVDLIRVRGAGRGVRDRCARKDRRAWPLRNGDVR